MRPRPFHLIHSSVDGTGSLGYYRTLAEAKAEADARQRRSDARGNPWAYRYHVFHPSGEKAYSTRMGPPAAEALD